MEQTAKASALILVSTHCPHCHTLEKLLLEHKKSGLLGELGIINIEKSPEVARQYGVRSVPWLQLGKYIFDEVPSPSELDKWIGYLGSGSGDSHYISYLLEHGKLGKAIEGIEQGNFALKDVISILVNPDAKINVRVGVGALMEHFEDTDTIRTIIPDLLRLLQNDNPAVRVDVCHYLSLTHSSEVIEPLKKMLDDEDSQVQQVARESIESLTV